MSLLILFSKLQSCFVYAVTEEMPFLSCSYNNSRQSMLKKGELWSNKMNDVFLSSIYDCIVIPIKDQIPKICSRIKNTSFNNVDVEEKFDVTNKQKAHLAKFNTSIFWGVISNCGFIIHSRWFMLIIQFLYKY